MITILPRIRFFSIKSSPIKHNLGNGRFRRVIQGNPRELLVVVVIGGLYPGGGGGGGGCGVSGSFGASV